MAGRAVVMRTAATPQPYWLASSALAAVALILLYRQQRNLRRWWQRVAFLMPFAGPSPLPTSSSSVSSPATQPKAVYEAETSDSNAESIPGLTAVCEALEAQLRNATEIHDRAKARKLRRVLVRLYDAMEVASGSMPTTAALHARVLGWAQGTTPEPMAADAAEHREDPDMHSVASDDSFRSAPPAQLPTAQPASVALPAPAFSEPVGLQTAELTPYQRAVQLALSDGIVCRKDRTAETQCRNRVDFLARLHCIRMASTELFKSQETRDWVSNTGRDLVGSLLKKAEVDTTPFHEAWNRLNGFLAEKAAQGDLDAIFGELRDRGCAYPSLFDCVIDFVLLDAFDDMKRLPASVTSVMENSWVPRTVKEKTLATAVWSMLRTRQSMLRADGMMIRFYAVMEHVSPVLAVGLLGCHRVEGMKETLRNFVNLVMRSTVRLFNFDEGACVNDALIAEHLRAVLAECEASAQTLC